MSSSVRLLYRTSECVPYLRVVRKTLPKTGIFIAALTMAVWQSKGAIVQLEGRQPAGIVSVRSV